jgi:serine/threonine-protein kinase
MEEGSRMKETKAGDSIEEQCQTCGKHLADCTCRTYQAAAQWPNLGHRAHSEGEMSARFSKLKEAGSGTIFLSAASEPGPSATTSIDLAPNAIIGGVYKIDHLVGRGGMGEVYLATHLTLDKKCALKVIPPDEVTEIGWQRFQLEAKIVAKLEHVNLVRVTDLGMHEECLPFYAMEYIDGQNLAEVLAERGPMPLNKALEIFMQVCDGVECAHRGGVLHRDLKPANIMLTQSPTGKLEVKILDFGLAKLTKHDRFKQSLTGSGDVFGSPCYMSPEQCGEAEVDSRSDIYSIGCTLFECLTGRPPFSGHLAAAVFFGHLEAEPPSLQKAAGGGNFPALMETVMAKLLRKKPADRYQTLSELKADLEVIAGDGSGPLPSEIERPIVDKAVLADSGLLTLPKRPRMRLWLGIVLAALIGLGGCFFYFQLSSRKPVPASVADLTRGRTEGHRQSDDREDAWDGTPFYKGVIAYGGKQCQHWQYLGHRPPPIYLLYSAGSGVQEVALAGDVYIPTGTKVCAMPKEALIHPPPMLNALTGGNLDEVDYEWYSLTAVEAANPAFAKYKSIKGLRIGNVYWSMADSRASLEAINQFPNLERLMLGAYYDGSTLAKIRRLKALKELRLDSGQIRIHDCLKAVSGSKKLLFLSAINLPVPESDLELVVKCPNLQRLMVGQLTGSHEQLSILARLSGLRQMELPALRYRPNLSADLRLLKSLKTLKFLITSDWTNEQLSQLRHDLPNVNVVTFANVRDAGDAFWLP